MKNKRMSENVNWLQVEAEYPELFAKFKSFLQKNKMVIDQVDKVFFNKFISDSKIPKFLNVPEEFEMTNYVVRTTFQGIASFLTLKK